jgi:uncharacterized protein YndB with AHSA1/START domain
MHLPIPPERVYQALDTETGRAAFWARAAPERNGEIEFRFANGCVHTGRVLERRPAEVWAVDYLAGEARFELAPDGCGGTDLLLTHRDVPPEEWNEVHAGWLNVLFPLKAWLVHGVELRNQDPARSWDEGYADQ